MDGKLKCPALGNHSVYITNRTQEHIKETHGQLRTDSEMKHKAKYIPFVPEILKNGKICEKSSSKQGVIYGIIGQVKYFDKKKNKSVIDCLELAINYDKDVRKFVFSFSDWGIKKSLHKSRDFSDHFWAGPIVDTKTVPITIYSLSDSPKKSSKNVAKSLFTDWKVELRHLCDKKGLNYDSVIQKYDDKLTRYVAEEQLHQDAENVIAYKAYKDLSKSLTYSGYKLQGRTKLYGMDISIENKKGTYRKGVDSDGHKWKTLMHYDYGYIRGTVGTDSDHVDCYIGPDKNSKKVYVIHQNNPITHKYDEDKCMLCFESADAAKKAYMKQYDRPGFFGSMETLTVEQFKTFVFSKQGSKIHKSFDVEITDITENNKQRKVEQVEKALNAIYNNKPFVIKHISNKNDNSIKYDNITLRIKNFDKSKIEKAVHKLSFSLDTDLKSDNKGESFVYKSAEDLTNSVVKEFTNKTKLLYDFIIDYFDLPEMRIVTKSNLRYKGKVIYDPETGEPIKTKVWDDFVKKLEAFLTKHYGKMGERIVLSARSLGLILSRLSKTQSHEQIKKLSLVEAAKMAKVKNLEWISESVKNMKNEFGESLDRKTQSKVQVAIHSAAQRVTSVSDVMRNDIQQIIIDGIKNKQSKSVVSQNLFDKCAKLNRDLQRIADTEIQDNANNAYILEEVYNNSNPEEKVYFKRFEYSDDNACKKCKKIKGVIAVYSDTALPSELVDDPYAKYAIWEGKLDGDVPMGVVHPWCRGSWFRYYPNQS